MITADADAACEYIKSLGVPSGAEAIPEVFLPFYSQCIESEVQEKALDVEAYAKKHRLSLNLVQTMNDLLQKDRQFRSQQPVNWDRQQPLDRQNQQKIDSLYQIHQTYIGRSLVGKKLEFAMWAVIQHSDQEMMARYLPVIHQAVEDEELDATCLKMLIDRYYWLTQKVQIFGSQQGVDLADQQMRNAVMKQYGVE